MAKRLFDAVASLAAIILLTPLMALVAVAIKFDSKGPVLFVQQRVGRGFRHFGLYKFRTMYQGSERSGSLVTASGDSRITRVGRVLRRTKIDELPQLFNVLKGDMSLVGPRPEVPKYVELFRADYEELLQVRPGITDATSVRYRDEENLLASGAGPENDYVERILPEKIRLSKEYVRHASLAADVKVLLRTVGAVIRPGGS